MKRKASGNDTRVVKRNGAPPAPPLLLLERVNPHPRDERVIFVEDMWWKGERLMHVYYIDGSKDGVKSVTFYTHFGFAPFNADEVIDGMMLKSVLEIGNEYYSMTRAQIKANWKEANERGTFIHKQIELYYNGLLHDPSSREFGFFLDFVRDFPELKIYRTEMNLFVKGLLLAGQSDALFVNENGEYEIYDWKVTKKIWPFGFCKCPRPGGKIQHIVGPNGERCKAFGYHPLTRDLQDCKKTHYTIQLNIYRWILKRFYGITAVRLVLIVLHRKQENYIRMELPIREDLVEGLMKLRYQELYPEPGSGPIDKAKIQQLTRK